MKDYNGVTVPTYSAKQAMALGIFCYDNLHHRCITNGRTRVIIVHKWSRDCDMCESSSVTAYPATKRHYEKELQNMEDSSEGPGFLHVIPLQDVEYTETGTRDRAMEAYENGRGANAFSV